MKKRLLSVLLVAALAASMLVGCGSSSSDESSKETITVGMVADIGGINDESFNQSAWEGLQQAEKDFGIEIKVIESKQASEYIPNMESLLDDDVDMVIGVGYTMKEDIQTQAENYPNKQFVLIDETYDIIPAIKPQIAFYEMYGIPGMQAFKETCEYAKQKGMIVIADIKRGDIGSTAQGYGRRAGVEG